MYRILRNLSFFFLNWSTFLKFDMWGFYHVKWVTYFANLPKKAQVISCVVLRFREVDVYSGLLVTIEMVMLEINKIVYYYRNIHICILYLIYIFYFISVQILFHCYFFYKTRMSIWNTRKITASLFYNLDIQLIVLRTI